MTASLKPRLRSDLEILVAEADGERLLLVRDPEVLAIDMTQFGIGVLPILQYFDGHHSLEDIRTEFARQGAGFLEERQLATLVQVLDQALLLDNESYRAEKRERDDFLVAPVRPAAHAGAAYPEDAAPAREFLQEMLEQADERPAAPDGGDRMSHSKEPRREKKKLPKKTAKEKRAEKRGKKEDHSLLH